MCIRVNFSQIIVLMVFLNGYVILILLPFLKTKIF